MFDCSQPLLFFDYFRVPVAERAGGDLDPVPGFATARWRRSGRALHWPAADGGLPPLPVAERRLGGVALVCRVVPDGAVEEVLRRTGGSWRRGEAVLDAAGTTVASIWRDAAGDVLLPFDPGEAMTTLWSEAYLVAGGGARAATAAKAVARAAYYACRGLLPRPLQIALRRLFSRVQNRSSFPRWPVEPCLHDLYDLLLELAAEVAGEPVPWIAPWPDGNRWALVLTHDVERRPGYRKIDVLRRVEEERGFRSSWNLVPERDYAVEDEVVDDLWAGGFEVGVHGLRHDGRDLRPRVLARRLPAIREAARRFRADGFRAPATHRGWTLMPRLGFRYDSSYCDTAPYEPQPGGCCSVLPFFIDDLVELPVTLPQDHNLFAILGEPDGRRWIEKASWIRERGGMATLITHPDYLDETPLLDVYVGFLDALAHDPTLWRALPREVAEWWRARAASRLEPEGRSWRVVGPAAGRARVEFAGAAASAAASAA